MSKQEKGQGDGADDPKFREFLKIGLGALSVKPAIKLLQGEAFAAEPAEEKRDELARGCILNLEMLKADRNSRNANMVKRKETARVLGFIRSNGASEKIIRTFARKDNPNSPYHEKPKAWGEEEIPDEAIAALHKELMLVVEDRAKEASIKDSKTPKDELRKKELEKMRASMGIRVLLEMAEKAGIKQ